jgi:hypothetical protein
MDKKVIRDGKVAVVITESFGGGWSTSYSEDLKDLLGDDYPDDYRNIFLFHPKIVNMVLAGLTHKMDEEWFMDKLGLSLEIGVPKLEIVWLPLGTKFKVINYDGLESIVTENDLVYTA